MKELLGILGSPAANPHLLLYSSSILERVVSERTPQSGPIFLPRSSLTLFIVSKQTSSKNNNRFKISVLYLNLLSDVDREYIRSQGGIPVVLDALSGIPREYKKANSSLIVSLGLQLVKLIVNLCQNGTLHSPVSNYMKSTHLLIII